MDSASRKAFSASAFADKRLLFLKELDGFVFVRSTHWQFLGAPTGRETLELLSSAARLTQTLKRSTANETIVTVFNSQRTHDGFCFRGP
jgi:hypothetical protein